MAQNSGACGRGVLVAHLAWARRHGLHKDAPARHSIPLPELPAAAEEQHTTFVPGDILLVRIGLTQKCDSMSHTEREAVSTSPSSMDVESGLKAAELVWDNQFSAVASDTPSFEAWRKLSAQKTFQERSSIQAETRTAPKHDPALHEIFLAGWGCPMGRSHPGGTGRLLRTAGTMDSLSCKRSLA